MAHLRRFHSADWSEMNYPTGLSERQYFLRNTSR
jgi:hypothetical protein